MSNKEYIINWDIAETTSVKNKTTLVFEDAKIDELRFTVEDAVLTCTFGEKSVNLSNFSKIKYAKTKEDELNYTLTDLINKSKIDNIVVYDTPKKNKITTTNYNDTVNLVEFRRYDKYGNEVDDFNKTVKGITVTTLKGKDDVTGSIYADKINTGDGGDTIHSSLGKDNITGGKGENTIIYSGEFDTDTITLSKSEKLTIDLKSYGINNINELEITPKSKNLEIKVIKDGFLYGTIILKNFTKSNVVGVNGGVFVDIGLGDPINLNTDNFLSYTKLDFSDKGVFNGTRFSENIDASGVTTAYGKNNKGVTIKAGAGYNTIIGTDGFNDKITGGNDGNFITSKTGNNTITTGNGVDIIKLSGNGINTVKSGKGADDIYISSVTSATIYSGSGENKITIDNTSNFGNIIIKEENTNAINNLIFKQNIDEDYIFQKSGKNLIIKKESDASSITINNYYKTSKKNGKTYFYINNNIKTLEELISSSKGMLINGKGKIEGTDFKDIIISDDFESKKTNNDIITPHKGADTINAGKGENSIYLYDGDGAKTIIDGGGVDTLVFTENNDLSLIYNNKDLIITYGDNTDTVTVPDYKGNNTNVQFVQFGKERFLLNEYKKTIFINPNDGEKRFNNSVWADTLAFSQGTELSFDYDNGNIIITYGDGDNRVILEDFNNSSSIKYLKNGDNITPLSSFYAVLDRGGAQEELSVSENNTSTIILTNKFDNKKYYYDVSSYSGEQTFTVEHLKNDRLVISGNYLVINARDDQADNIILLGGNNTINTKDENDIVRVGVAIDTYGYYAEQSDYTTVNAGDGDDYVSYFGIKNKIDMGDGTDKVCVIARENELPIEKEDITNSESTRSYYGYTDPTGDVDWFNQGAGGGDCRLFALLDSLNKQDNFNLNDYVEIVDNEDDTYNVTFKNYTCGQNTTTVSKDDLTNYYAKKPTEFDFVYGDLDVVLIDYAMNKLIDINKNLDQQALSDYAEGSITIYTLDTVQKAYYNTISNYIFGNEYITPVDYTSEEFTTRLNELWELYEEKTITNITIGIQADHHDLKNSILTGHAYSIEEYTENYITLINPWDNADKVTVDISTFYGLKPCIMVYGSDYYDEHYIVDNGFIRTSDDYINNIYSETANWIGNTTNDSASDINYATNEVEKIGEILYPNNPEI